MGLVKNRLMYTSWPTPTGLGSAYIFRYTGISNCGWLPVLSAIPVSSLVLLKLRGESSQSKILFFAFFYRLLIIFRKRFWLSPTFSESFANKVVQQHCVVTNLKFSKPPPRYNHLTWRLSGLPLQAEGIRLLTQMGFTETQAKLDPALYHYGKSRR